MPDRAPTLIQKSFDVEQKAEKVTESLLELINENYALEPMTAEEVFIFKTNLANDQYDRAYERFTKDYLNRFKETLPGRPVLRGHNYQQEEAGKFLDAHVVRDANGVTHLQARAFLAMSDPMAAKVRAGICKGMSIGFVAADRTCDLCGKSFEHPDKSERCEHWLGQEYEGKRCTLTYSGDLAQVEMREGSFVFNPCQYGAEVVRTNAVKAALDVPPTGNLSNWTSGSGVILPWNGQPMWGFGVDLKSTTRDDKGEPMELKEALAEIDRLTARVAELEKDEPLVDAGKAFRKRLTDEITRLSAKLDIADASALILKNADRLPVSTLEEYEAALWTQHDKAFPPKGDGVPAPPPDPTKAQPDPPIGRWRPSYAVTPRS